MPSVTVETPQSSVSPEAARQYTVRNADATRCLDEITSDLQRASTMSSPTSPPSHVAGEERLSRGLGSSQLRSGRSHSSERRSSDGSRPASTDIFQPAERSVPWATPQSQMSSEMDPHHWPAPAQALPESTQTLAASGSTGSQEFNMSGPRPGTTPVRVAASSPEKVSAKTEAARLYAVRNADFARCLAEITSDLQEACKISSPTSPPSHVAGEESLSRGLGSSQLRSGRSHSSEHRSSDGSRPASTDIFQPAERSVPWATPQSQMSSEMDPHHWQASARAMPESTQTLAASGSTGSQEFNMSGPRPSTTPVCVAASSPDKSSAKMEAARLYAVRNADFARCLAEITSDLKEACKISSPTSPPSRVPGKESLSRGLGSSQLRSGRSHSSEHRSSDGPRSASKDIFQPAERSVPWATPQSQMSPEMDPHHWQASSEMEPHGLQAPMQAPGKNSLTAGAAGSVGSKEFNMRSLHPSMDPSRSTGASSEFSATSYLRSLSGLAADLQQGNILTLPPTSPASHMPHEDGLVSAGGLDEAPPAGESPVEETPPAEGPASHTEEVAFHFMGNAGAGKSTIANCIAGEVLFNAGVGCGSGVTRSLAERTITHGRFTGKRVVDFPGLADEAMRKKAAKCYNQCIMKAAKIKPIFVLKPDAGRILEQDKTTINFLLSAAPEIGQNYSIIVNQCGPKVMRYIHDREWRKKFEQALLCRLPAFTSHIYYQAKLLDLEEADNATCKLDRSLHQWLEEAPVAELTEKEQGIPEDDMMSLLKESKQLQMNERLLQEQLEEIQHQLDKAAHMKAATARANIKWLLLVIGSACIAFLPAVLTELQVAPFCTWFIHVPWLDGHEMSFSSVLLVYYLAFAAYRVKQVVDRARHGPSKPHAEFMIGKRTFYIGVGYIRVKHIWTLTRSIDAVCDWLAYAAFLGMKAPACECWTWLLTSIVTSVTPIMYVLSDSLSNVALITFERAAYYLLVLEDIEQLMIVALWQVFGSKADPSMKVLFSAVFAFSGVLEGIIVNRPRMDAWAREASDPGPDHDYLALV